MTPSEIIDLFKINDDNFLRIIQNSNSILVDLKNIWTDGDSFQIIVNKQIRECEAFKIVDEKILIIDSFTQQVTILLLKNNESSLITLR